MRMYEEVIGSRRWYRAGRLALLLLLPLTAAGCASDLFGPRDEFAAATRAVERWVQRHPDGWTLALQSSRAPTRPSWSRPCSQNPDSGSTALEVGEGATRILLFFRCPIGPAVTEADLNSAFSHAVLDPLPHGISSRGWRFDVRTPSSAVQDGVRFVMPTSGRVRLTVQAPLYAVSGHSTRAHCQPPADAPSPDRCYIVREHRIPLELSLSFPISGSEFR